MVTAMLVLFALLMAAAPPDYVRDIKPLLQKKCLGCHGPANAVHGLRLDTRAGALKGGNSGAPALVPGKSAESLIIRYTAGLDKEIVMPPAGGRLTSAEVDLLREWIAQGASYGDDPSSAPVADTAAKGKSHWSFQPIARPAIPAVRDAAWVKNPIDAFILAKLEAKGWKPAPEAQPHQLLRTVGRTAPQHVDETEQQDDRDGGDRDGEQDRTQKGDHSGYITPHHGVRHTPRNRVAIWPLVQ